MGQIHPSVASDWLGLGHNFITFGVGSGMVRYPKNAKKIQFGVLANK